MLTNALQLFDVPLGEFPLRLVLHVPSVLDHDDAAHAAPLCCGGESSALLAGSGGFPREGRGGHGHRESGCGQNGGDVLHRKMGRGSRKTERVYKLLIGRGIARRAVSLSRPLLSVELTHALSALHMSDDVGQKRGDGENRQ